MSTLYRDLIKSHFNQKYYEKVDFYQTLKNTLNTDNVVDEWFSGVIKSLFYRPNQKLLVLCGNNAEKIIENILPPDISKLYTLENVTTDDILYSTLIYNTYFESKRDFLRIKNHNFVITDEPDKRLCSYVSTVDKWTFLPRKDVIVVDVNNVEFEQYLLIDKMSLWRQLYKTYKQ